MMMRAIHIFPDFENVGLIDELRQEYDPLATKIPPHITLVHPFTDEISNESLIAHVQNTLKGARSFHLRLQGVTGSPNGYLFLNVKRGNDEVIGLRDCLYTGVLAPYYYRKATYVPHLTVGQGMDMQTWEAALLDLTNFHVEFVTTAEKVVIEEIAQDDSSRILYEHHLTSLADGKDERN